MLLGLCLAVDNFIDHHDGDVNDDVLKLKLRDYMLNTIHNMKPLEPFLKIIKDVVVLGNKSGCGCDIVFVIDKDASISDRRRLYPLLVGDLNWIYHLRARKEMQNGI